MGVLLGSQIPGGYYAVGSGIGPGSAVAQGSARTLFVYIISKTAASHPAQSNSNMSLIETNTCGYLSILPRLGH